MAADANILKNMILIYSGKGVGATSLKQTKCTFSKIFRDHNYQIRTINLKQLLNSSWESRCALLIMPGGADVPYDRALRGKGNAKILNYVKQGGRYLGICAGAYYGTSQVIWNAGKKDQIIEDRELKFFKGSAIGPAFKNPPYSYTDESSARIARLTLKNNDQAITYYNGGCLFKFEQKNKSKIKKEISILAKYRDLKGQPAAIILSKIEKGKAVLCGPHPEFDPSLMNNKDPHLKKIIKKLHSDQSRFAILELIFNSLDLSRVNFKKLSETNTQPKPKKINGRGAKSH
ncbi:MAG TPA: BPL-N domain-containing protein [Oligoflexia bacterium]|nr:BPL-N domain-containing protein [Oligoflexia bacterium]HMP27762.1 BPL-N domain-containing protein [Oligoflexia bacterium]